VWQALRTELHPALEIVTVALDTAGPDAARPWIERANPDHPSLIDQGHVLDELLGVVNVPSGIWVDEAGVIVRPPEPAFPRRQNTDKPIPEGLPTQLREMLEEARKIQVDPERYVAALRDWVANGAESRFALTPDEVVARSRPRSTDQATAAACFELGQHLHRTGHADDAVRWFREALRLQPDNWTYKRQAWTFADPFQGRTDQYEGSWLDDVRKVGAENYYEPLDL
jgi:tetratricopeptide (TPR) repeat protein